MRKSRLSDDDIKQIQEMIGAGCPYGEIAERFGISRQYIYAKFGPRSTPPLYRMDRIVYPNLAGWMYRNQVSRSELAKLTHFSQSHVAKILTGRSSPTFEFILVVLRTTGMTFEEAFSEKKAGCKGANNA